MLQPLIRECLSKGPIQNLNTKSVIENIKYFSVSRLIIETSKSEYYNNHLSMIGLIYEKE